MVHTQRMINIRSLEKQIQTILKVKVILGSMVHGYKQIVLSSPNEHSMWVWKCINLQFIITNCAERIQLYVLITNWTKLFVSNNIWYFWYLYYKVSHHQKINAQVHYPFVKILLLLSNNYAKMFFEIQMCFTMYLTQQYRQTESLKLLLLWNYSISYSLKKYYSK